MQALFSRKETDMTKGNIVPLIVSFAMPLLLGNIFQQLYNMVDTWVVGNYVGKNAFSAVGTLSSTTNTIIGFFTGFSSGAGVAISQWYGAKDMKNVSKAVHTYVAITIILCILFTSAGVICVPVMMKILKSPAEVAAEQVIYLRIYFSGISGLLLYNMGAAIFRAVGNSVLPFLFLVASAVINTVLDLVFVLIFRMGTAGVAYATIIAQGISAALVIINLFCTKTCVRVHLKNISVDAGMLKQIVRLGIPSGFQMSITAFSNMFVQSYINFFGSDVMGGWTAYTKVEQVFFLPMQSIGIAASTFTGQNVGCSQIQRAKTGANKAVLIALGSSAFLLSFSTLFSRQIVQIFISQTESEVIRYGSLFLKLLMPFHLFACFNQVYSGALRGAGKSTLVMATLLFSFVVFRQIYLFIMSHYISNTVIAITMSYPAGWFVCSLLITIAFFREFRTKEK